MLSLDDVLQPVEGVIGRETGSELVLVLPDEGRFLVLNDTGAQIWQLADGQRSLGDIAVVLAETWQIESARAQGDVLRLAGQLVDRAALVKAESA